MTESTSPDVPSVPSPEPEPTPMPTPPEETFEIPAGRSPNEMGLLKLRFLSFSMDQSDEEMRAVAEQAVAIKQKYTEWQHFYEDLEARKKRLLGFRSVVMAMDVTEAAQLMKTSPQLVQGVMVGYAQQEENRIKELEALWAAGQLPDRPVLTDPSKEIIAEG